MNEQPDGGKVGEHLIAKDRAEIGLDIGGTREARIVAHEANAIAREYQSPKALRAGIQPVLKKRCWATAGQSFCTIVAELRQRLCERFDRLAVFVAYRRGNDDRDAPRFGFPCNAVAMAIVPVVDWPLQSFKAERFPQQVLCDRRSLRRRWSVDLRPGLPVRLPDTEVAGYLIAKRRALWAMVIDRGLRIGCGCGDLGKFLRTYKAAFDMDCRQTDIGGPLQVARHYSPSGSRTYKPMMSAGSTGVTATVAPPRAASVKRRWSTDNA